MYYNLTSELSLHLIYKKKKKDFLYFIYKAALISKLGQLNFREISSNKYKKHFFFLAPLSDMKYFYVGINDAIDF